MNNQCGLCGAAETGWRVKWRKFWRKVWEHFFGDIPNAWKSKTIEYVGENGGFPGDLKHMKIVVGRKGLKKTRLYVARFCDDAFSVCIGYPDQWKICLRRTTLHRLIFWYLWRFAYGEWFGLRRYLYCKFLHRRCEKIKKFGKK